MSNAHAHTPNGVQVQGDTAADLAARLGGLGLSEPYLPPTGLGSSIDTGTGTGHFVQNQNSLPGAYPNLQTPPRLQQHQQHQHGLLPQSQHHQQNPYAAVENYSQYQSFYGDNGGLVLDSPFIAATNANVNVNANANVNANFGYNGGGPEVLSPSLVPNTYDFANLNDAYGQDSRPQQQQQQSVPFSPIQPQGNTIYRTPTSQPHQPMQQQQQQAMQQQPFFGYQPDGRPMWWTPQGTFLQREVKKDDRVSRELDGQMGRRMLADDPS
jgi:hypothetical protein